MHWVGEGVAKLSEYLIDSAQQGKSEDSAQLIQSLASAPSSTYYAVSVARLGLTDYREGKAVRPEELRAVYVRPSDAEINERWQQQKQQQQA